MEGVRLPTAVPRSARARPHQPLDAGKVGRAAFGNVWPRDPIGPRPTVSVLALIPARGGSKGIPRKNLVTVGGRPLLHWSVDHALEARAVDRVVVSTDDAEIAAEARRAGAEVPFLRPQDLAGDEVTDLPVFQHALAELGALDGYRPRVVVHLRPTSPLRPPGLVDAAVTRLDAVPDATSLRSITAARHPPHKLWWQGADGMIEPVLGTMDQELFNQPRQVLPVGWRHDGVIDVVRTEALEAGSMTGRRVLGFTSPEGTGIDIDTLLDLQDADARLRAQRLDDP